MTATTDDSTVETRLEIKKKRLSKIIKKLKQQQTFRRRRHLVNKKNRLIRYCGPFSDSSRQRFFLLRE